jgi:hypothetical protein
MDNLEREELSRNGQDLVETKYAVDACPNVDSILPYRHNMRATACFNILASP